MFFKLIRRNSRKNYKENGIYFVSLMISIVAFYVVLSLEKQDVMIFLKQMESDAVTRLLGLLSGVYGFSLFLIFFLIYFAEKYQLERRSHEFGLFLMLGMKRSRLFCWLMAEDFYSGTMALIIGLPIAVLLSELISLVTAKVIGLGIIGHQFSLSVKGLVFTALGFLGIKFVANILLSSQIIKKEPCMLMKDTQEEKMKVMKETQSVLVMVVGIILLAAAYILAILGMTWENLFLFAVTMILGAAGTFLLIKGFCAIFSGMISKGKARESLHIFTFRQLQENVFLRSVSLSISSLLILIAIACMSYGIAVAVANVQDGSRHSIDFTVETYDKEGEKQLQEWISQSGVEDTLAGWSRVLVAMLPTPSVWGEDTDVTTYEYDSSGLEQAASNLNQEQRKTLESSGIYRDAPHMIALSGLNEIRKRKGEDSISLNSDELLVYIDPELYGAENEEIFNTILKYHPKLKIGGEDYLIKGICSEDIVVDRSITIGFGIVLTDERFMQYADKNNISTYWNAYLLKTLIAEKGLLQAIMQANDYFNTSGFEYENYLQNIGRQLFYIVAASYLTIYLALIFLIIANTVISLQFLMQQKKTRRRYQTLICLGSTYEAICQSSRRQIKWYFGIPFGVAAISSIFGVCSLFSGILPTSLQTRGVTLLLVGGAMIVVLCVIEYCYVKMVMRISNQNILQMMEIQRSE